MYDPTPAPFGDVTRLWTSLSRDQRQLEAERLLGSDCDGDVLTHVDRPARDKGVCYYRLVPAAVAGEPVALGWAATTHRPLLLMRGRALFEHDPGEWGSVCLELLHSTLAEADLSEEQWLRRRVAGTLSTRLYSIVARHLARRRCELPTATDALEARQNAERGCDWAPHPDLSFHLDQALRDLDAPTQGALLALANREPLARVAARHGLPYDAVRQRVTRARKRLQPELDTYRRGGR